MRKVIDRLEGGYRVVRIRQIRRWVYLVIIFIIIGLSGMVMAANGASLYPFFLPLDMVIAVFLIMLLLWSTLGLFFRNLEIRYLRSNSKKYLMARNSIRKGLGIIFVCAFLGVLIMMPYFSSFIDNEISESHQTLIQKNRSLNGLFYNMDDLGLTRTRELRVRATGGTADVCIYVGEPRGQPCDMTETIASGQNTTFVIQAETYQLYTLNISTAEVSDVIVDYTFVRNPSPTVMSVSPVICFILVFIFAGWVVFLNPVKRRYATTSIFSDDYVAELGSDEIAWKEYMAKREALERAKPIPPEPTKPIVTKKVAEVPEAKVPAEERPPPPPPPEVTEAVPPPPELQTTESLMESVRNLVSKGNFEGAIAVYEDILKEEPQNTTALIGMGTALASLGRVQEALDNMKDVLTLDPKNRAALMWMERIAESKSDWKEALNWQDRYLGFYPEDDDAWIKHGDILFHLDQEAKALDSYRNALKINPENDGALRRIDRVKLDIQNMLEEAVSRSAVGDHTGALREYDSILRKEPTNVKALVGKGATYRRLSKVQSSVECIKKALEIDPENEAALINMAGLMEIQEDYEGALQYYDALLSKKPEDEEILIRKGELLAEMNKPSEALKSFEKALEINPLNEAVKKKSQSLVAQLEVQEKREAAIRNLCMLPGIGRSKAEALYKSGFTDSLSIERSTEKQLASVKGISPKIAKKLIEKLAERRKAMIKKLSGVPGIGPSTAKAIYEAGFTTPEDIGSCDPRDLAKVKGVGHKRAKEILAHFTQ